MLTENFAVFLNLKEHGEVATYTQQGGGQPKVITVIFEANYTDPLKLVQSEESTAIGQMVDMPNVMDGDLLTCRSKNFTIRIAERDWGGGEGFAMLHLEEV